jgi:hypothetical protein
MLAIERVRWRATLAGCNVTLHQHLGGTLSLTYRPHRLGRYTAQGVAVSSTSKTMQAAVEKSANRLFHPAWKSRSRRGIPTFPPLRRLRLYEQKSKTGHFTCYKKRTSLATNTQGM